MMDTLHEAKAAGTRRDYDREVEKFTQWLHASKKDEVTTSTFGQYFRAFSNATRFQNSGWPIATHLRWYMLREFGVYVSSAISKIGMHFVVGLQGGKKKHSGAASGFPPQNNLETICGIIGDRH